MTFSIVLIDECQSTNDEVLNYCPPIDKLVICSKRQNNGRGRREHKWISDEGNLFASVGLFIDNLDDIGLYSLAAAVSLGEAMLALEPTLKVTYKWPNDVLLDGKKVAGILLESAENPLRIVIGIGVNIVSAPLGICLNNAVNELMQKTLTCEEVLNAYLSSLNLNTELIRSGEKERIITKWLLKSINLNKPVKLRLAKDTIFGLFKGLDNKGNLILQNEKQEKFTIPAGEILL